MNLEKLKSFFTQLFTALDTDDSFYILLFLAVAYLLGLLFGAMSRNRKIRRLKKMVKERDNDLITTRAENGSLKEKLEINEERLQKAETDYEDTYALLGETEKSRHAIYAELTDAKELVGRLGAQNAAYAEEIDQLNLSITQNAAAGASSSGSTHVYDNTGTTADTGQTSADSPATAKRISAMETRLTILSEENIHLRSQLIDIKGQSGVVSDDSLAAIKARLEQVELENDRLQKDLLGIKGSGVSGTTIIGNTTGSTTTAGAGTGTTILSSDGSSPDEREAKARAALNTAYGSRIKKETAANKSNLKLIAGIGPFIENKLNDIGIFTFEQITQLDDELIGYITDAIQFFPGRIQRDDWVGQARKLIG